MALPTTSASRLLSGAKEPVRVASSTNVDIAAGGLLTVDGVTLAAGDRVLLMGQTDASQNGIYSASAGEWYRASDAMDMRAINAGVTVYTQEGTANALQMFQFTSLDPDLGTDDITLVKASDFFTSYVDEAEAWAQNPENDAVIDSPAQYSALHHSAKASAQRALAEIARLGAEGARDAALVGLNIYTSTAAGLAAVGEGEYFLVTPATPADAINMYRDDAGVATHIATYPSTAQLEAATDAVTAMAALWPRDEYVVHAYNDGETNVAEGGYPFARSVTDARSMNHVFAEILNGVAGSTVTVTIRIEGAIQYGPTVVTHGTPLDVNNATITLAVGDEVRVELYDITGGGVYSVWTQIDGEVV